MVNVLCQQQNKYKQKSPVFSNLEADGANGIDDDHFELYD